MALALRDICNNNIKNMPSQELYNSFNNFICRRRCLYYNQDIC